MKRVLKHQDLTVKKMKKCYTFNLSNILWNFLKNIIKLQSFIKDIKGFKKDLNKLFQIGVLITYIYNQINKNFMY